MAAMAACTVESLVTCINCCFELTERSRPLGRENNVVFVSPRKSLDKASVCFFLGACVRVCVRSFLADNDSSKSQLNVVADVDKAEEYPSKYFCYCYIFCSRADHHVLFLFQDHEEDDQMTRESSSCDLELV
jgi:hypothetical protein